VRPTNFTARIITDIIRDDGVERQHTFEIEANLRGQVSRFTIPSCVFKTALLAVCQQHFGAAMDPRNLPANWTSTDNSIEGLTFLCKDTVMGPDDFKPGGTVYDQQRHHQKADRIYRNAGNHAARRRMPAYAPEMLGDAMLKMIHEYRLHVLGIVRAYRAKFGIENARGSPPWRWIAQHGSLDAKCETRFSSYAVGCRLESGRVGEPAPPSHDGCAVPVTLEIQAEIFEST
jgi:hypothetical protein